MLRWDFRLAQPSRGHPKIAIRIRLPHRGVTPHPARSTLLKVSCTRAPRNRSLSGREAPTAVASLGHHVQAVDSRDASSSCVALGDTPWSRLAWMTSVLAAALVRRVRPPNAADACRWASNASPNVLGYRESLLWSRPGGGQPVRWRRSSSYGWILDRTVRLPRRDQQRPRSQPASPSCKDRDSSCSSSH